MNRRDFLKGVSAVGAATASVAIGKADKKEPDPRYSNFGAENFTETENVIAASSAYPTLPTIPVKSIVCQISTAVPPVKVLSCSDYAYFKLKGNICVGELVEINESHEIQKLRKGSIPVGVVVNINHMPDGTKECTVAMHGVVSYACM